MAQLKCPNGHLAVVRNDPNSVGRLAMCDRCGWEAPIARAEPIEPGRDEVEEPNHGLRSAQEAEQSRRQLTASGQTRRGGDRP